MDNLNNCYDCAWRDSDECHLHRDENGNPEPIYDEPTDCEDFVKD